MKDPILDVVYQSRDYLVLNKPWGIASLDEHVFTRPSMLKELKRTFPQPQLCHRLDKETSGCLLVALHPEAYRHAALQFEWRKIEKEYLAICSGVHHFHNITIDLPLFSAPKKVRVSHKSGKPAQTVLQSQEVFKHFTAVRCKPITGRLHQIRVHLASQNAPIVNDMLYGGQPPLFSQIKTRKYKPHGDAETEAPIISRIALHAHSIGFQSLEGEQITIEAPLPKELQAFLKILRRWDGGHENPQPHS
jgi:23S rRNA pseudouridine955/2504/2580 synthase